jgi:hypothetical protein
VPLTKCHLHGRLQSWTNTAGRNRLSLNAPGN